MESVSQSVSQCPTKKRVTISTQRECSFTAGELISLVFPEKPIPRRSKQIPCVYRIPRFVTVYTKP